MGIYCIILTIFNIEIVWSRSFLFLEAMKRSPTSRRIDNKLSYNYTTTYILIILHAAIRMPLAYLKVLIGNI